MADAKMEILIGANTAQLDAGLEKGKSKLKQFGDTIKSAMSTQAFALAAVGVGILTKQIYDVLAGTNKLASAQKLLNNALKDGANSTRDEVIQLQTLYSIAKDVTQSYNAREEAIRKLNKLYPERLKYLSMENIGLAETDRLMTSIIESMVKEAQLKALLTTISELSNSLAALDDLRRGGGIFGSAVSSSVKQLENRIESLKEKYKSLYQEILGTGFKKPLSGLGSLIGETKIDDVAKKILGETESELIARAKRIHEAYKDIIAPQLDILPEDEFKKQLEKAKKYLEVFLSKDYKLKINVELDLPEPPPAEKDSQLSDDERWRGIMGQEQKKFDDRTSKDVIAMSKEEEGIKKTNEEARKLQETLDQLNETIKSMAVDSIAMLGESLGTALAGGDLKGVFEEYALNIASGLQTLGRQIIAAAIKVKVLQNAMKKLLTQPALAIAAGIALIAVGASIKQSFNKGIQGRAAGGPVSGNTPYLIGEKGPELFVPSTSGRIVPNHQLGGIQGMAMQGVVVSGTFVQRGRDLVAVIDRQNRYQTRGV